MREKDADIPVLFFLQEVSFDIIDSCKNVVISFIKNLNLIFFYVASNFN